MQVTFAAREDPTAQTITERRRYCPSLRRPWTPVMLHCAMLGRAYTAPPWPPPTTRSREISLDPAQAPQMRRDDAQPGAGRARCRLPKPRAPLPPTAFRPTAALLRPRLPC